MGPGFPKKAHTQHIKTGSNCPDYFIAITQVVGRATGQDYKAMAFKVLTSTDTLEIWERYTGPETKQKTTTVQSTGNSSSCMLHWTYITTNIGGLLESQILQQSMLSLLLLTSTIAWHCNVGYWPSTVPTACMHARQLYFLHTNIATGYLRYIPEGGRDTYEVD